MPIYEYRCKNCDASFDVLIRSLSSVRTVSCDICGSDHVEKMVSTFAAARGGDRTTAEAEAAGTSSCGTCTANNCSSCR